jgi:pimeloyl-ACP methyl ester carboxylesterase
VRLIAPDRPGYGRTDFVAGLTTIENWPTDVMALADHLGLQRFAVFGASGGGPYALSCAWAFPERITCAGLFGSVGPFVKETEDGLNYITRMLFKYGPRLPGVLMQQMKFFAWLARKHPLLFTRIVKKEFGTRDRILYESMKFAQLLNKNRIEAYRQNGIGSWYDAMLPANWTIPLEEIKVKVYLWQGKDDATVSLAMGKYLANRIPDCEALFLDDAGHLWIFEHFSKVVGKLAQH